MCGKTTTYHQIKTYLCSIISRNPIKRDRDMRYSVIIPVYNRPDEVDELLQSLTRQSFKDFEVIIVEDGSSVPCKNVADRYQDILNIRYYSKPNSGPGQTRNYGAERSRGEYLIILDSDCILPEDYFQEVEKELQETPARRLWWTRPRTCLFYRCAKSHQLLHDFILHHRRYSRREKENGQVLSEELQYGSTPRGLRSTRRLLSDAFWRRHRFQHPHLQRRIQVQAVSRSMGISQTTDGPEEILQASAQFRHCPHQPLQETSRLLENRASAARHIHTGSSGATGRRTFLPIQPPTGCAICTARLHRLRHSKQEPAHRPLFHCRILHSAHRIWNRILESLVEPLHTRQR